MIKLGLALFSCVFLYAVIVEYFEFKKEQKG